MRNTQKDTFLFIPTLHRFLFKELVQTFVLCAVSLLTLILISRGVQMRELFLNLDLSFWDTALLFAYMMPLFLLLVLPISCMLSIFLTFLRMSTDRELVALKASGISIFQLVRGPMVFSTLCMLLAFAVSMHGIAWGMGNFRALLLSLANTKAQIVLQPGVFNQDLLGKTLFTRSIDPKTGTLYQVIFEDRNVDAARTVTFIAPEGNIETDQEKGEMHFTLKDGRIYQVTEGKLSVLEFKRYLLQLDISKLLSGADIGSIRPKEMGWETLLQQRATNSNKDERFHNKVGVEVQKRLALPVACVVLGLFAIPVACFFEGVHRQVGVVAALVMFLMYYSMLSLGFSLGEAGALPPAISIWMANALFALLGVGGLVLVGKERVPQLSMLLLPFLRKWKKAE